MRGAIHSLGGAGGVGDADWGLVVGLLYSPKRTTRVWPAASTWRLLSLRRVCPPTRAAMRGNSSQNWALRVGTFPCMLAARGRAGTFRSSGAGCGWLTRAAELALWLSLGHSRALEAHRRCPHGLGQRQRGSGVSAETARAHSQRSSAAPTARSQPKGSAKRGAAARRHPLPSALP